MKKPYVICHMLTSLDGKIDGNVLWLRYISEQS